MPSPVMRRKYMTLEEKVKVILDLQQGMKKAEASRKYEMASSTVSSLWVSREKLLHAYQHCNPDRIRMRKSSLVDIDCELMSWVIEQRTNNVPVKRASLKDKAEEFARLKGDDTFVCSGSWLDRFKVRCNINPGRKRNELIPWSDELTWFSGLQNDLFPDFDYALGEVAGASFYDTKDGAAGQGYFETDVNFLENYYETNGTSEVNNVQQVVENNIKPQTSNRTERTEMSNDESGFDLQAEVDVLYMQSELDQSSDDNTDEDVIVSDEDVIEVRGWDNHKRYEQQSTSKCETTEDQIIDKLKV